MYYTCRIVTLILIVFTLGLTSAVQTKELNGGGIVYANKLGISLEAPNGWIFESSCNTDKGPLAVMYQAGLSWSTASEVMYISIVEMEADDYSLEKFILGDIEHFKENSPNLKIKKLNPFSLKKDNVKAEVRLFSEDKWGNYECVAYVQKGSNVAIYVLSCRTQKNFEKKLIYFKEMVENSFFIDVVHK